MHEHTEKRHQLAVVYHWGVHHHIVQMLAQSARVVGDDDVPVFQAVCAINLKPIAHSRAQGIGHKNGQAAPGLGHRLAGGVHNPDRVIFVLADEGAEGRSGDVLVDLVRNGHQVLANHFERDRVGRVRWHGKFRHRKPPN